LKLGVGPGATRTAAVHQQFFSLPNGGQADRFEALKGNVVIIDGLMRAMVGVIVARAFAGGAG
jgi:hypothetical protein